MSGSPATARPSSATSVWPLRPSARATPWRARWSGRPPFIADDAVAVIAQHMNPPPVAPSRHNPAVPRSLDALILRLLAKAPGERPASAGATREALAAIAPVVSPPAEPATPGTYTRRVCA